MRTDLMTPQELTQRLANGEDHLELSIEKHERARLKENWEQLCKNPKKYFYFDACGLCKKYMKDYYSPDSYICNGCPLSDGLNIAGCGNGSLWDIARVAINDVDREVFLKYSLAITKKMEAAR